MPQPSWSCSFSWPFVFMYILDCKAFLFSFNIYFLKISEFKKNIPVKPYEFLWLLLLFLIRIICNCVLRISFFRMFYSSWAIFLHRIYHQGILNNFLFWPLKWWLQLLNIYLMTEILCALSHLFSTTIL